jgi:hypothetical protein
MAGFTKLYSDIITSSIWSEDDHTRILWVTMLALADAEGFVPGSVAGLAPVARLKLDDCKRAIGRLESPDEYSRTADHDGRRIEPCDGGWLILNYAKFRARRDLSQDPEAVAARERMRRRRDRTSVTNRTSRNMGEQDRNMGVTSASASVVCSSGGDPRGGPEADPNRVTVPPPRLPEPDDTEPVLSREALAQVPALLQSAIARFALAPMDATIQRVRANIGELLARGYTGDQIETVLLWATHKDAAHLRGRPQSALSATDPQRFAQWLKTMQEHEAQLAREEAERKRRNR